MKLDDANPDQIALLEHLIAIHERLMEDYRCSIQGEGWSMSITLWDRVSGRQVWQCDDEPRVIAERFADWIASRENGER